MLYATASAQGHPWRSLWLLPGSTLLDRDGLHPRHPTPDPSVPPRSGRSAVIEARVGKQSCQPTKAKGARARERASGRATVTRHLDCGMEWRGRSGTAGGGGGGDERMRTNLGSCQPSRARETSRGERRRSAAETSLGNRATDIDAFTCRRVIVGVAVWHVPVKRFFILGEQRN